MTPCAIFQKNIEFGVTQEPPFPHLGTFYIRKIQTFLRRCRQNTTIDSQKLTDFICVFFIQVCIQFFLVNAVLHAQLSIQEIYSNVCTVIYGNVHDDIKYMSQILNNMQRKLINDLLIMIIFLVKIQVKFRKWQFFKRRKL